MPIRIIRALLVGNCILTFTMSASTDSGFDDSTADRGQTTVARMPLVGQLFAFVNALMAGLSDGVERAQMGAKRIGSLAIGIGVVGIVLNQMDGIAVVNSSTGVIDVGNIFSVAGDGLQLLVVGVIIAAAAVLLNLWSGF